MRLVMEVDQLISQPMTEVIAERLLRLLSDFVRNNEDGVEVLTDLLEDYVNTKMRVLSDC